MHWEKVCVFRNSYCIKSCWTIPGLYAAIHQELPQRYESFSPYVQVVLGFMIILQLLSRLFCKNQDRLCFECCFWVPIHLWLSIDPSLDFWYPDNQLWISFSCEVLPPAYSERTQWYIIERVKYQMWWCPQPWNVKDSGFLCQQVLREQPQYLSIFWIHQLRCNAYTRRFHRQPFSLVLNLYRYLAWWPLKWSLPS